MFIDTHAHLNFDPFRKDPAAYISRALKQGVTKILIPGIDLKSSELALSIADTYSGVYAAVGVHPHDCEEKPDNYLQIVEQLSKHEKAVAIGEIGMDHFRDYAPRDIQLVTFQEQMELAKSLNMPVIIHDRAADDDVWDILQKVGHYKGQSHCYTGGLAFAEKLLGIGLLMSFTGIVTFSKSIGKLVKQLPLEKLMIETDSPFMAPEPFRGKTCEPSYVVKVAEKYAEFFDTDVETVANITSRNAEALFSI